MMIELIVESILVILGISIVLFFIGLLIYTVTQFEVCIECTDNEELQKGATYGASGDVLFTYRITSIKGITIDKVTGKKYALCRIIPYALDEEERKQLEEIEKAKHIAMLSGTYNGKGEEK